MSSEREWWPVEQAQREDQRSRVASNLINMAFARGASVSDSEATQVASSIEKKAFTVAEAESKTTTGTRPAKETLNAYVRCKAASYCPCSFKRQSF